MKGLYPFLLVLSLLSLSLIPGGTASPEAIYASMDSPAYVRGMTATARAMASYSSTPDGTDTVTFRWFLPDGNVTVESAILDTEGPRSASASSTLLLPTTGVYYLDVVLTSDATSLAYNLSFEAFNPEDMAVVMDIRLELGSPVVDPGGTATATAILTYAGNATLLEEVSFQWYRSPGDLVFAESRFPTPEGRASSVWPVSGVGQDLYVVATYGGVKEVAATSSFSVGTAFAEDSQDRAATMFLLLFMTSLVGLYIAARHVKKRRNGFQGRDMRADGSRSEKPPELEPGEAYLVTQGQNKALKVFAQELKKGHSGLCITRTYPDKLKGSWDLEGAKVYWLTNGQAKEKEAVSSLESLADRIDKFLSREEKGVVLLDGVEYLFVQNSFTEVMKLLQTLKDTVPSTGAKLIIPIDLLALVERQRALLTREFKQL
ncbi:MAG: DUF835 domain-containing protein [Thermoplasmata archaeon]